MAHRPPTIDNGWLTWTDQWGGHEAIQLAHVRTLTTDGAKLNIDVGHEGPPYAVPTDNPEALLRQIVGASR